MPPGVNADIMEKQVTINGPKGSLSMDFDDPRFNSLIDMTSGDGKIALKSTDDHRKISALCGAISAHINNMIKGVKSGYKYEMKIIFTHFPITITSSDDEIHIKNFLGEKGARIAKIVKGAEVHVDKEHIEIKGIDIEAVGQTAANIELACKIKKRDRRIFQDGIYLSGRFYGTGEKI